MEERDVVLGLLAPADEHAAVAVHPAVRPLHHPPPRLGPRPPLQLLRLLAPRPDVRREAELLGDVPHLVVVVALIQAQPLRLVGAGPRPGPVGREALRRRAGRLHVVAVGAVHGQAHRDAAALDQQTALGAALAAVGGVLPRLFPPRAAPWSCTRPAPATTNPGPSGRRRPSARPPTWRG